MRIIALALLLIACSMQLPPTVHACNESSRVDVRVVLDTCYVQLDRGTQDTLLYTAAPGETLLCEVYYLVDGRHWEFTLVPEHDLLIRVFDNADTVACEVAELCQ